MKKSYQKWQIKKLITWFLLFVTIGGIYLSYATWSLYQDKTAEEQYWQSAMQSEPETDDLINELCRDATVVTTGTYVESLKELNMKSSYYRIVVKIWFRWQGDDALDMVHNFHIYNGTINKLEVQKDTVQNGWHYQLASVDVSVFKNFWTKRFPLESHQLRFYIEPDYDIDRVVQRADDANSESNASLSIAGYHLNRIASAVHTQVYNTTFGEPGEAQPAITSELMTQLELNRSGFGLYAKCFIALIGTSLWVFITMFLCTYHRIDPLVMIPAALFGTVSNIMVGANLLPDALEIGLLEYVNVWGILTILGGAIVIININRIRNKYNDNKFAVLYGRVLSFSMVGIILLGHVLMPIAAYIWA